MALIPHLDAKLVQPINEVEYEGRTYLPGNTVRQGFVVAWDANLKIIETTAVPALSASLAGIALRSDRAGGMAIKCFQRGFLWGFDLTGRVRGDLVYAGVNGTLDTAGNVLVGEILPFNADGVLAVWVDFTRSWAVA
jgi:hypothetical protein